MVDNNRKRYIIIAVFIFIVCCYLSLSRLGDTYFWDDEAQVGIIAKNLADQGKLTGWDGRNLYAYRNGTLLDEDLRPINPPLDYLLAAASLQDFHTVHFCGPFSVCPCRAVGLDRIRHLIEIGFRQKQRSLGLYLRDSRLFNEFFVEYQAMPILRSRAVIFNARVSDVSAVLDKEGYDLVRSFGIVLRFAFLQ